MCSSWENFRYGKTKKPDVKEFEKDLKNNLNALQKELKTQTYVHSPYTTFFVKDPKLRKINKACVRDRVVHHAVFSKLYPIFDRAFIFDSYSCRIDKGTHRAVRRLHDFFRKESRNNSRQVYVLKCDVRKFFDSIDQDILMGLLRRRVKDSGVLWLLDQIIKSFSSGLPLGNITSQLFSNIYLNELDIFIKHDLQVKYYIRYCDDFVILRANQQYLEDLIPGINDFLKTRLKLSLHPNKVIIRPYRQGIDFLGYVSFPNHTALRLKTKKRMFKKMALKHKSLAVGEVTKKHFMQTLQSYLGMLKHCNAYKVIKELQAQYGEYVKIKQ